jgi:hypothetical protein
VTANELERQLARRTQELAWGTSLNEYRSSDPATLRATAEAAFREELGRKPSQDALERFVNRFLDEEKRQQKSVFDAQDQERLADRGRQMSALELELGGGSAASGVTLDRFMDALAGQESGGNYSAKNARTGASGKYQIMPANWPAWSKEAGLGANAARTPENQERVARFKMQQYHQRFGSWDAVAVAWYAGPGAAKEWIKNPDTSRFNRKQGKGNEPSINEYVRSVNKRLGGVGAVASTRGAHANSEHQQLKAAVERMIAEAPGKVTPGKWTRTYEEQVRLYNNYKAGKGPLAAKPGTSKHGTGRANDLSYENQATKRWVLENAHRYGLHFPLLNAGEDWHVELAGNAAGHSHGGGVAPVSRDLFTVNLDPMARATEQARNENPAESRAFDIGTQFQTLLQLISRGVGV